MPEIVVAAEKRTETGKNVNRRLRSRGLIPGVLYGAKSETTPVDVSELELGKHIRVGELKLPDKVKVLTDPGLVVAHVVVPRAEEVAPTAAEAAPVEGEAPAEPEVIKKGKAEAAEAGEEKPERPERAERGEKAEKGEKKEKKEKK